MKLTNGHFREKFGEFGSTYYDNEFFDMAGMRNAKLEEIIQDPGFVDELRSEVKGYIRTEDKLFEHNGRKYIFVEKRGKTYGIIGQILMAKKMGVDAVNMGTRSPYCARVAAEYCQKKGLNFNVCLSVKLSDDERLKEELKSLNANVDDKTCKARFDMPEIFALGNIMNNPNSFMIYEAANASSYPYPDLVGKLSSVFFNDLAERVAFETLDACLATIDEGTDAVGLYEYLDENNIRPELVTCEKAVCQEYHNSESLITRAADPQEAYTTLCPELAYLWRMGKVIRLGCDSLRILNTAEFKDQLDYEDARTIMLAEECMHQDTETVLVLGGKYD